MNIILAFDSVDKPYLSFLKSCVSGDCIVHLAPDMGYVAEIATKAAAKNSTRCLVASEALLKKLTADKAASLTNYQGSYFRQSGIEFVILAPLDHLAKVPEAKFLARRYISKFTDSKAWFQAPKFQWKILGSEETEKEFWDALSCSIACGVDIETIRDPLHIKCIAFSCYTKEHHSYTYVLPVDSMEAVLFMRAALDSPVPKAFQNGKYDIAYLLYYGCPVRNYLMDTANMHHSSYSELPKDLGMVSAFYLREGRYWKGLANTSDLHTYYEYNARDAYATVMSAISWLHCSPEWGYNNYLQEFPVVFPCILCEATGIKRDVEAMNVAAKEEEAKIAKLTDSLEVQTATPNFNSNSPPQVKALLSILGNKDIAEKSSDEKSLKKASLRHPLSQRVFGAILKLRKSRKLASTYLVHKEFNGRILYSLNPHGTDTSRLASKEHHFWTGLQIQNIPRGKSVKQTLVADPGFLLVECDLEQAESRDTGYAAGEEKLIAAVSGVQDFHSLNASAFFGIPYEKIYSDEAKKTLDKALRDLAKRVNHGANYCMGPDVLIDTMGEDKVIEAARMLGIKYTTLRDVAVYLLAQFHKTYPALEQVFYPAIVSEIRKTGKLVSKAVHLHRFQGVPHTRFCFGKPWENKLDKNSYVAHVAQSLNAQTLNRAFLSVFYDIALHQEHAKNFRLLAQIHDSILFQIRVGHSYLAQMVKERMEIPVRITDPKGITREFTVPAAIKAGKDGEGALRWSETE